MKRKKGAKSMLGLIWIWGLLWQFPHGSHFEKALTPSSQKSEFLREGSLLARDNGTSAKQTKSVGEIPPWGHSL